MGLFSRMRYIHNSKKVGTLDRQLSRMGTDVSLMSDDEYRKFDAISRKRDGLKAGLKYDETHQKTSKTKIRNKTTINDSFKNTKDINTSVPINAKVNVSKTQRNSKPKKK